jgi:hypothetical protein
MICPDHQTALQQFFPQAGFATWAGQAQPQFMVLVAFGDCFAGRSKSLFDDAGPGDWSAMKNSADRRNTLSPHLKATFAGMRALVCDHNNVKRGDSFFLLLIREKHFLLRHLTECPVKLVGGNGKLFDLTAEKVHLATRRYQFKSFNVISFKNLAQFHVTSMTHTVKRPV